MPKGTEVRPKKWQDPLDLYDDGDYSAIWGYYDGSSTRRLGVRWNGEEKYIGFPNHGGNPIWHCEPDFLENPILFHLFESLRSNPGMERRDEYLKNIQIALKETCNK